MQPTPENARPRTLVASLVLALVAVLGGHAPLAAQKEVIALLSQQAKPYEDALAALQTALQSDGLTVRKVVLSDLDQAARSSLMAGRPAAFVGLGTAAAKALTTAPDGVPAVYCMVSAPARVGAEAGRLHGVTTQVAPEVALAVARQAFPRTRRIAMLYRSDSEGSVATLVRVDAALRPQEELVPIDMASFSTQAAAIKSLFESEPELIWTTADPAVFHAATVRLLLLSSIRNRVPVFGFSQGFVKAGAVAGVSVDPADQGRQAADVLRAILRGDAVTGTAPEVVPPRYSMVYNAAVANKLGIELPQAFVDRARSVTARGR